MNIQNLLTDIHALEEELLKLERKFEYRSETFMRLTLEGKNRKTIAT